jgi:general secretion pathway protein E
MKQTGLPKQKAKHQTIYPNSQVGYILRSAIDNRASDIHLEPKEKELEISLRIDGMLYSAEGLVLGSGEKIISKIKVSSGMDITEHRLPQEGQFEFRYNDRIYDVRVSALPTSFGETIVLRILNRESILMALEGLGFDLHQLSLVNKLITSPCGMVLISGPSGSGKTTLLYSILNTLNKPSNNIITVEDPIELRIPNIRQVQVKENIGLDFARAIRSVLRQDPDVIMLGEIRDVETAEISIQAALMGILVFSTFHTLNVPGLVTRLIEMDIPHSVVAQAIVGVVSARLARKVCDSCAKPYQPTDQEKKVLGEKFKEGKFRQSKGCERCLNSGFLGRAGVFEVVRFDDQIRSCIIEKKPFSVLQSVLVKKGVKSLRDSAFQKAAQGIITLEEAIRITGVF